MVFKKFACLISYETDLSLRKITDDYLEVLLNAGEENAGILTFDDGEEKIVSKARTVRYQKAKAIIRRLVKKGYSDNRYRKNFKDEA